MTYYRQLPKEKTLDNVRSSMAKFLHSAREIRAEGWTETRQAVVMGNRYLLIQENFPEWRINDIRRMAKTLGYKVVNVTVAVTPVGVNGQPVIFEEA